MPPPSPPQPYQSRGQSANVPPLSSTFLSRDPPSNPAHRPGSSMSISSMLGDGDRPTRDPGSSSLFPRPAATSGSYGSATPLSAPGAMSPPSTTARRSFEYPFMRRSQTPDKPFSKNQSARPYRSSSGGIPQTADQSRFGPFSRAPSSSQYPEKHGSMQHSPQVSPTEAQYNEARRSSLSGPAARPNSQPQHLEPSPRTGYSPLSRPPPESSLSSSQRPSLYSGFDPQYGRFGGLYADRQAEDQAHRDRDCHLSDPKAPYPQSHYFSRYGERESTDRHSRASTWDLGRSQPPSPESKRFPAPEPSSGFGFGAIQSYTKSLGGPRQSSMSIHPREEPRQNQRSPPPSEQPYLSKLQSQPRLFAGSAPTTGLGPYGSPSAEEQRRKGNEELFHHRNLLGVGVEGRKADRASPLPQAVQGAQAQIVGPGAESGMKNDLGRVFSGIGSGVGGVNAAAAGSGHSTPMTTSPFKRDRNAATGEATDDIRLNRPESAARKPVRKSRDEDAQLEGETSFERAGASGRGSRRGRHLHHHHHQYVAVCPTIARY